LSTKAKKGLRGEIKPGTSSFFLKPPKVIGVDRVIGIFPVIDNDGRRNFCFIPAAADKSVARHDPSHNGPMSVERFNRISGAGRVHGASIAVHRGYIGLIKPDDRVFCMDRRKFVKSSENSEKNNEKHLIPG
jgi:hypothetical protein